MLDLTLLFWAGSQGFPHDQGFVLSENLTPIIHPVCLFVRVQGMGDSGLPALLHGRHGEPSPQPLLFMWLRIAVTHEISDSVSLRRGSRRALAFATGSDPRVLVIRSKWFTPAGILFSRFLRLASV